MPVKFVYSPYVAAAINQVGDYANNLKHYNPYYSPHMSNTVGTSSYLMSKENMPQQGRGNQLNFLA
jgi:hypothetical protein